MPLACLYAALWVLDIDRCVLLLSCCMHMVGHLSNVHLVELAVRVGVPLSDQWHLGHHWQLPPLQRCDRLKYLGAGMESLGPRT